MKKLLAFTAAAILAAPYAHSAIIFNPADPLNVVDQGGFTGGATGVEDPFVEALVRFTFTGLNPTSFQISGISLQGDGITGSLSFSNITITGNGTVLTSFGNLSNPVSTFDFANSRVSFTLPGGDVINDGAQFTVTARYRSGVEFDQISSSTGPVFEAIPEPSTYALLLLAGFGLAAHRWRRRSKTVA